MEDNQNAQPQESSVMSGQSSGVSFPTINSEPKKSGGIKTLLVVGVLILVAILGFVIYKSASNQETEVTPEPTSFDNLTTPSSETVPTFTPAPSASPAANMDKSKVEIQVQNGTGITGEAAYLQNQLKDLGYTNVKVGNSDATVTATSVTFATSLDGGVVSEITQKLNTLYQTVTTKTSSTGTFDIVIVTGLRKGATAKPSGTATPRASGSPTPVASGTKSPSPTPTSSP